MSKNENVGKPTRQTRREAKPGRVKQTCHKETNGAVKGSWMESLNLTPLLRAHLWPSFWGRSESIRRNCFAAAVTAFERKLIHTHPEGTGMCAKQVLMTRVYMSHTSSESFQCHLCHLMLTPKPTLAVSQKPELHSCYV